MGLEVGMNLSVEELLYGLLLPSGNDAALQLAEHLGGEKQFVGWMNQRVRRLGLSNTHFVNPDGRDAPDHYSSALDMALLGRELMANPALKTIVGTDRFMPNWDQHVLWNGNELLYVYEGANGVKIGYTEQADSTIVAGALRDGRQLIVSVLHGWNLYGDSMRLLNWAFANTKPAC
jgi:D-alanyl-D-alanine carboxypeptidase (penicillin-binding protein 5/6)